MHARRQEDTLPLTLDGFVAFTSESISAELLSLIFLPFLRP